MIKRLLFTLLAAAVTLAAQAQQLSRQQILGNAQQFAAQLKNTDQAALRQAAAAEFPDLHLYNIEGGGWVIASGDSRTRSILAYSDKGAIDPAAMPDNVRYWLQGYERQMARLDSIPSEALAQVPEAKAPADLPTSLAPLLTSTWDQGAPGYSDLTPYDRWMDMHVYTGCVATAFAQVMRYWQWPEHGYGSHTYTHRGDYGCWRYDTLSVNFDTTTYDWAHMPDSLTDSSSAEERLAVATLCYHCGVAFDMSYNRDCHGSSSADFDYALAGMKRYFHYGNQARRVYRSRYEDLEWNDMLKRELAAGRPIPYAGGGTYNEAHAFVFDGYDQNYFHVNWGWSGRWDGYFSPLVLHPGTARDYYIFEDNSYCIIGLEPSRHAMPVLALASDLVMDSAVYGMGNPITGSCKFTNVGDTTGDFYVRADCYGMYNMDHDWVISESRLTIAPGDTVEFRFSGTPILPESKYYLYLKVSTDTIVGDIWRIENYVSTEHNWFCTFDTENRAGRQMANLFLFLKFQDELDGTPYKPCRIGESMIAAKAKIDPMFHYSIGLQHLVTSQWQQTGQIRLFADPYTMEYYSPYDANVFPNGDPTPYPLCGPSERETGLVARVVNYIDSLQLMDTASCIDNDGDGEIDHLVVVYTGYYNNTYHLGAIADHTTRYPDTLPPLTINGKRVGTYSILYGRKTDGSWEIDGDAMTKAICRALGLPSLEHKVRHKNVLPTADNSILTNGLRAPSAIFKHRYLGLGEGPVEIASDGTFTINSSDDSLHNNLYYIQSTLDSNQWYLIEYRRFYSGCATNGLYISRWMSDTPTDACYGGNIWADYYNTPNNYWTFRPGSAVDTVNGTPQRAFFTAASGRTLFNITTDPHPYLADGTPENAFKIYDIAENGTQCSFKVHFYTPDEDPYTDTLVHTEGIAAAQGTPRCTLYPNPASGRVALLGNADPIRSIALYDMMGRQVADFRNEVSATQSESCRFSFDISRLPRGTYIAQIQTLDGNTQHLKLIKD